MANNKYSIQVCLLCAHSLLGISFPHICSKPTWNLSSRSSTVITFKKSSLNPQAALKDPFPVPHYSKDICLSSHCVVQWFVCLSNDPSPKLWTLMSGLISDSRPYPSAWHGPDTRRCLVTVGLPQAPLSLYLSATQAPSPCPASLLASESIRMSCCLTDLSLFVNFAHIQI